MSWIVAAFDPLEFAIFARLEIAFLVSPDGTIFSGDLHQSIVLEHKDDLPEDLKPLAESAEETAKSFGYYNNKSLDLAWDIVLELLNRGWCRGRFDTQSLNLELSSLDMGKIEGVLSALPPEMLDTYSLYVEVRNDPTQYIKLRVRDGEDALEAFKKRGRIRHIDIDAKRRTS